MKNLLSENMLRFGTKNLSESTKTKLVFESIMQTIKEHGLQHAVRRSLLTEAPIDLLTTKAKDVAAANKFFNASFAKKIYSPTYLMSANEYCLKTTQPYNPDNIKSGNATASGPVLSFIIRKFKTKNGYADFHLPILPDDVENGLWTYNAMNGGKITEIRFDPLMPYPVEGNEKQLAEYINYSFSQLDLATIEKMYTAKTSIKGPGYMTLANTKPLWTKVKPLLTGNAKAFFASK